MSRRRSTIHDVAALRLHPNGARVPLVSDAVHIPTSSVVTAKTKRPLLDVRGNWTATDAGGDGRVTKRRRVNEALNTGNEELVDDGEELQGDAPTKVYKDARANRRVAFENDFTFLADPAPLHGSSSSLPQPSSDFLKSIHHFACQHYAASGQLFDSAAQYRKEKKERRQLRMLKIQAQAQASGSKDATAQEESDDEHENSDEEPKSKGEGRAKSKTAKQKVTQRDMYKAFDGSALLCIGMLLQSHIWSTLRDPERCKPDGWEDIFSPIEEHEMSAPKGSADSSADNCDAASSTESSLT